MDLSEQLRLFHEIQARVAHEVRSDDRVLAVWLGGSLGRGQGDVLSDIDLVVVAREGRIRELVESSDRLISVVAPAALVHNAPQNAPLEGQQLNVLYDTSPLPVYIDWNLWPTVAERPSDVAVLLEKDVPIPAANDTFQSMLVKMPPPVVTPKTADEWDHFRVFMVPILLKSAARGWFESVHRILEYMQRPNPSTSTLDEALELAGSVLDDCGKGETVEALACIRRYMSLISDG